MILTCTISSLYYSNHAKQISYLYTLCINKGEVSLIIGQDSIYNHSILNNFPIILLHAINYAIVKHTHVDNYS